MPKLSGNKGEWSEIYVFLRLLEAGKLYAADAELNRIDDVFYDIINIIRTLLGRNDSILCRIIKFRGNFKCIIDSIFV